MTFILGAQLQLQSSRESALQRHIALQDCLEFWPVMITFQAKSSPSFSASNDAPHVGIKWVNTEWKQVAADRHKLQSNYLTSNHHVIVMVLEFWYVCFDFPA